MENFIFCAEYGAAFSEEPCVTLVTLYSEPEEYSESCQAYMMERFLNEPQHIQNLVYPEPWHILKLIYSEPCPLYNNKNFIHFKEKRI